MYKSVKRRRYEYAKKMERENYSINCEEKTGKTSGKEHRSIKLMSTMYKIYDEVFKERLRGKLEGRKICQKVERGVQERKKDDV